MTVVWDFERRHADATAAGNDGQITGAIATWRSVIRLIEAGTPPEGILVIARGNVEALRELLDPADR